MPGPNSETWRGRIDVCQGIICNQSRIRSLVYSSSSILNWPKIPRAFRTQKLNVIVNVNKVEREMCRSTSQPFNQPQKGQKVNVLKNDANHEMKRQDLILLLNKIIVAFIFHSIFWKQ